MRLHWLLDAATSRFSFGEVISVRKRNWEWEDIRRNSVSLLRVLLFLLLRSSTLLDNLGLLGFQSHGLCLYEVAEGYDTEECDCHKPKTPLYVIMSSKR